MKLKIIIVLFSLEIFWNKYTINSGKGFFGIFGP